MLGRRFRRDRENGRIAAALYGAIVAHARAPAFYAGLGVPDTVEGRFEMMVLHTALVVNRLGGAGEAERRLGQQIFDLFCNDMDGSLRELGIGDLAVPKQMKRMAERFYGRLDAYRCGIAAGDAGDLAATLARNLPGAAGGLSRYVLAAATALGERPASALFDARPAFPEPGAFVTMGAEP
jgi:cytochrome b pre-mRNA-processing protein 3